MFKRVQFVCSISVSFCLTVCHQCAVLFICYEAIRGAAAASVAEDDNNVKVKVKIT